MAAKKKTVSKAEVPAGKKVPLENLRRSCVKLFKITPSTFDGATVGLDGKFTVEEMRAIIDKWLNKEV